MRVDYVEGDCVVCVNDDIDVALEAFVNVPEIGVVRGRLYTVARFVPTRWKSGFVDYSDLGVELAEPEAGRTAFDGGPCSYSLWRFRKAYTPSIDVATERVEPVPTPAKRTSPVPLPEDVGV